MKYYLNLKKFSFFFLLYLLTFDSLISLSLKENKKNKSFISFSVIIFLFNFNQLLKVLFGIVSKQKLYTLFLLDTFIVFNYLL